MFTLIGLFFITLLSMVLYLLYKNEFIISKNNRHHAKIEEYWTGKERRKYNRFKKTLDVIYAVAKKSNLGSKGRTIDISEGGVKLLLDEKLPAGTIMGLKISTPASPQDIEVEGEIVWCEEDGRKEASGKRHFYHGIKFLAVDEPSGKRLNDYLHSIAAEC